MVQATRSNPLVSLSVASLDQSLRFLGTRITSTIFCHHELCWTLMLAEDMQYVKNLQWDHFKMNSNIFCLGSGRKAGSEVVRSTLQKECLGFPKMWRVPVSAKGHSIEKNSLIVNDQKKLFGGQHPLQMSGYAHHLFWTLLVSVGTGRKATIDRRLCRSDQWCVDILAREMTKTHKIFA